MEGAQYSVDPDGIRDFGNIERLEQTEGGFRIIGDFGDVHVLGGTLHFAVSDSELRSASAETVN
jgi:hypothetical protein